MSKGLADMYVKSKIIESNLNAIEKRIQENQKRIKGILKDND